MFICSIIFIMYWLISLEDDWGILVSTLFYASVFRTSFSWYYSECNEYDYCSNDLWTFGMVCLLAILFFLIFLKIKILSIYWFHKYLVCIDTEQDALCNSQPYLVFLKHCVFCWQCWRLLLFVIVMSASCWVS